MAFRTDKTTEEEIIANLFPNKLYSHDFGDGRYFQVLHEDKEGFEVKVASKTLVKVKYIHAKEDFQGIEIIKIVSGKEKERVSLTSFNLKQIRAFLEYISSTKISEIPESTFAFLEDKRTENIKERIKKMLEEEGGDELLQALLNEDVITSKDIVNTAYRKKQLEIFKLMLDDAEHFKVYAKSEGISATKEEKVWQHFFDKNDWIFGYGLDYRFNNILQREFYASGTQADGSESVICDYLLGDSRFTSFVEIKKPSTPLFAASQNRSMSWKLSSELIDSITQILEHKASGQIKLEAGQNHDGDGNLIDQKAYDPKVILIIGKWEEINGLSSLEKTIKQKTFELLRRDSRNVEILTFDELYDRAHFIVHSKEAVSTTVAPTTQSTSVAVGTPRIISEPASGRTGL